MGTGGRAWTGPLTFDPPSASASFSSAPCVSPRPSTPPSASWARKRRRRSRWCPPPARGCAFRGPLLVPCLSLGAWRVLWRPVAGCAGVSAVVCLAKCSSRGGSWTTSGLLSPRLLLLVLFCGCAFSLSPSFLALSHASPAAALPKDMRTNDLRTIE